MTTDNGNVLIETRGLEKSFGDVKVLKGITTEIKKRRGCCYHRSFGLR